MTIAVGAVGAQTSVAYGAETTYGVVPAAPSLTNLRAKLGAKFELKKETFSSQEMSSTRQVQALTYGNRSGSGEIPFELSYGAYDDLLEAAMGGTWTTNVLKCGNTFRSFYMEQTWPDINLSEVNTGVVLSGFSLSVKPNAIVEGSFTHMFKDQTFVHTPNDGTTTMAFDTTTITRSTGSFITDGYVAGDTVTIRGADTPANNINAVIEAGGVAALVLTFPAATFTVDTAKTGVSIKKTLDASITAAPTNPVFDSFTGSANVGGSTAIITGLDIKFEQAATASNVLFDPTIQQVALGTIKVTGTAMLRFINNEMKKKFIAGTPIDITFTLGGTALAYTFDMSSVYLTDATTDAGENELTQSFPFEAIYNGTDATALMITRDPS